MKCSTFNAQLSTFNEDYPARPCFTASTNAFAFVVIAFQSPLSIASLLTSADPAPTNTAPALIHCGVVLVSTPPVGVSLSCGRGARMSLKYPGPSVVAGNTLTTSAPEDHARRISVGVY